MQKIIKFFRPRRISLGLIIFLAIFLALTVPLVSYADLVPCDNVTTACDFNQFMNLINIIIHFILFDLAIPIAALMFFYAGFELVTSGGSTEKRGIAKKVFTNAALGLIVALFGWLIIRTILLILGYDGAWIGL